MNTTAMDEESLRKTKEYNDRYRSWQDKRVSQLSFHNNLLLTLAKRHGRNRGQYLS